MSLTCSTFERIVLAPDERRHAVLDVINSAQTRLMLSLFRCDDRRILDALAAARRRGVRVDALLTRRAKGRSNLKLLHMLLQSIDIRVWRPSDRFAKYHAKYMVADDGPALVGSLNFTRKCFKKTSDFLLVTHDPDVVSGLSTLFEIDCSTPSATLPRLSSRLIIGPDLARQQIASLFAEARHSIRIVDPKLSDPAMLRNLSARAASGVKVSVLGDRTVQGLVSHGKLLIVDERAAALGSLALSACHLDDRREIAVIVRDPLAVKQLVDFFDTAALRTPVARPAWTAGAGELVPLRYAESDALSRGDLSAMEGRIS